MTDNKTPSDLRVIARRLIHRRADGVVVPPRLVRMYAEALQALAERRERRAGFSYLQNTSLPADSGESKSPETEQWLEGYFEGLADARAAVRKMISAPGITREQKLGFLAAAVKLEDMIKRGQPVDDADMDVAEPPKEAR